MLGLGMLKTAVIAMFGLGTSEIILIAIVIIVLFGSKKIPELMQGIGKGIKEFKKASRDNGEPEIKTNVKEDKKDKE
jgi:sec-independent protein translocase protein TatA